MGNLTETFLNDNVLTLTKTVNESLSHGTFHESRLFCLAFSKSKTTRYLTHAGAHTKVMDIDGCCIHEYKLSDRACSRGPSCPWMRLSVGSWMDALSSIRTNYGWLDYKINLSSACSRGQDIVKLKWTFRHSLPSYSGVWSCVLSFNLIVHKLRHRKSHYRNSTQEKVLYHWFHPRHTNFGIQVQHRIVCNTSCRFQQKKYHCIHAVIKQFSVLVWVIRTLFVSSRKLEKRCVLWIVWKVGLWLMRRPIPWVVDRVGSG